MDRPQGFLRAIDGRAIQFFKRIHGPLSRCALFLVFFWFGVLKILSQSPASPLVHATFERTISGITFQNFMILFGSYEMLIGIFFLLPRFERAAILLLLLHMGMTTLPLILLPEFTWTRLFVPTLEGQYIIKNIAIIALAIGIGARLTTPRNASAPRTL